MKRILLIACTTTALGACTDHYGRIDPLANAGLGALVGAGIGGIGGAIARDNQGPVYRRSHGYGGGYGSYGSYRPAPAYTPSYSSYSGWGY